MLSFIFLINKINVKNINKNIKECKKINNSELIFITDNPSLKNDISEKENIYILDKNHGFCKMAMFGALLSKKKYITFLTQNTSIPEDYYINAIKYINKKNIVLSPMNNNYFRALKITKKSKKIKNKKENLKDKAQVISPTGSIFLKEAFFRNKGFDKKASFTGFETLSLSINLLKNKIFPYFLDYTINDELYIDKFKREKYISSFELKNLNKRSKFNNICFKLKDLFSKKKKKIEKIAIISSMWEQL